MFFSGMRHKRRRFHQVSRRVPICLCDSPSGIRQMSLLILCLHKQTHELQCREESTMRIPEDAWVWAVLIGFALPIFPNEEKNENGEECRFLSIKMVEVVNRFQSHSL